MTATDTQMKRIAPGYYEDALYRISFNAETGLWMTLRIEHGDCPTEWMQNYGTLWEAKEGVAWCHENDDANSCHTRSTDEEN